MTPGRFAGLKRVSAALSVLLVVLAASAGGASAATTCLGSHWVGAWGAAPAAAGPSYANKTVRLVVNSHRSGGRLRLRFSNRFGSGPLTISRVTVARRLSGPQVVAGSVRPVTFGGRRSVTIPRGSEVLSDPAALLFLAFADLTVSAYLQGPTGATSQHPVAMEAGSYTASGDRTQDASGQRFGTPSPSWPLLTGVEAEAPRDVSTVVALGDSITDGFASTAGQPKGQDNTRWPDVLARRLASAGRPYSVVNEGISGNRLRFDGGTSSIFGPSAVSRLNRDVLGVPGVGTAIVLEGINDLGQSPPASSGQVIASLRGVILRLRFAGVRVLVGTLIPSGGYGMATYGSAAANAKRQAVNRWIRTGGVANGVIDFDAAVRDPLRPSRMRPVYDSGDHLHPNAQGYFRMGGAVPLSLFAPTGC